MKIRTMITCAAFAALGAPAVAQTALTLGATGQASVPPDEAVATLTAQATAKDAATAQSNVNKAVADALAQAGGVQGVKAVTAGYSTYSSAPDNGSAPQFTAQQSLTLTEPAKGGVPSAAFSALLGKLQNDGLMMNGLDGDLSAAGQEQAASAAIADALRQIQSQAQTIAETLHERVGVIRTLSVNANATPGPRPMMAMAMRAAPVAPQSAPDNVSVTADVTAEIDLPPRD